MTARVLVPLLDDRALPRHLGAELQQAIPTDQPGEQHVGPQRISQQRGNRRQPRRQKPSLRATQYVTHTPPGHQRDHVSERFWVEAVDRGGQPAQHQPNRADLAGGGAQRRANRPAVVEAAQRAHTVAERNRHSGPQRSAQRGGEV